MRHRIVGAAALMLWIASAGASYGAVRIGVRDGKKVIYNDGVASTSREALARGGGVPPYDETRLYVRKGLAAYYGKSSLQGGFGLSKETTWGARKGRAVRLVRDGKNRPLITTDLSPARALKVSPPRLLKR